jgi:FG-GAP-like repeat
MQTPAPLSERPDARGRRRRANRAKASPTGSARAWGPCRWVRRLRGPGQRQAFQPIGAQLPADVLTAANGPGGWIGWSLWSGLVRIARLVALTWLPLVACRPDSAPKAEAGGPQRAGPAQDPGSGRNPGSAAPVRGPTDKPAEVSGTQSSLAQASPSSKAAPVGMGPEGPRFGARRQLRLPSKPRGLLATTPAKGGTADLWVLLEDPGEVLRFAAGRWGAPLERWSVGSWGLGPVELKTPQGGPTRVVMASMSARCLFEITTGSADLARVDLPGTPVDLAGAPDGSLWVLGRAGELWRCADGALVGQWRLDVERATALAIDEAGSLWIAAQVPSGVYCLAPADFATAAAQTPLTPTLGFALDEVPRDLLLFSGFDAGPAQVVAAVGEQSLYRLDKQRGTSQRLLAPGKVPMALTSADLDADGQPELIDINRYDTSYGVLSRFDAAGQDFAVRLTEYAGQSPAALACADFDGDGQPDLAIANRDAQALSLLPGSGRVKAEQPAFYQAQRLPVGSNPLFALCADLHGDGAPEGFSLDSSSGSVTWFQNRHGRLVEPRSLPIGPSPSGAIALDWNQDGHIDLAVLLEPTSGSRLVVLFGDGQGALQQSGIDWPVGRANGLWSLPWPGGERGLAVADGGEARLGVWRPGDKELRWQALPGSPRALASAGPGAPLWLAIEGAAPELLGLMGPDPDGSWRIALRAKLPLPAIELALLNSARGQHLGLLGALSSDQKAAQLFLADVPAVSASGQPSNAEWMWVPGPVVGQKPMQMAAGDLDGDGQSDLAIACQNEHAIELYALRSGPAGQPSAWQRWPDLGAGLGCFSVALADLDQNGRLDVLAANAFSHDLSVIYALEAR